jgi:hypothetical protein
MTRLYQWTPPTVVAAPFYSLVPTSCLLLLMSMLMLLLLPGLP